MIMDILRIAVDELRRNLGRSLLTSLGILLGVGAVIAMVGLGQGATASIESDLASMGPNLLSVQPGARGGGPGNRTPSPPFDARDADAIWAQVDHLAGVAPEVSASATVVRGERQTTTTIRGSTPSWLTVQGWTLGEGRLPTEAETRSGAAVCVLGATPAEDLFDGEVAVGGRILVGRTSCTVIGLLASKGSNTMGMDQDDLVLMPLATVQRRVLGVTTVSSIYMSVDEADQMDGVVDAVTTLMRERRSISPTAEANFHIRDTREMAAQITGITTTMTAFLGAVAGVSLLVGGIGIMNIMLVSVTERTREIGIRMAIGAQEGDVMLQFLVESALLSTLGGSAGVVFGLAGSYVGAQIMGVAFVMNPVVVVIAVGFSGFVGVVFGWVPARRAARMEPIDALRH